MLIHETPAPISAVIVTEPDTVAALAGAVMVTALVAAALCGFVFAAACVAVDPSSIRVATRMATLRRLRWATRENDVIGLMPLEVDVKLPPADARPTGANE